MNKQDPKEIERTEKAIEPKYVCDDSSLRLCKSRDPGCRRIKSTEVTKRDRTLRKITVTTSEGERTPQQRKRKVKRKVKEKSKRRTLPPEKK